MHCFVTSQRWSLKFSTHKYVCKFTDHFKWLQKDCIIWLYMNIVSRYSWYSPHHDDVIKWKHVSRYWPFVWGIHRSPVNSPHKGQWRGAFIFPLICVWVNGLVNNQEAGDLRCQRAHYDVIVIIIFIVRLQWSSGMAWNILPSNLYY